MKKAIIVATALVLALAGCSSSAEKPEESTPEKETVEETVAEDEAPEEEEPVEEVVEEEDDVLWHDAATAEEAAKGAGIDKFGVLDYFAIGDLEYQNPTFAYAGGVAQAIYETPATAFIVRKGVGSYIAPLSDRELDEFASKWNKVFEGTDVACYGVAKGAVTVARWTDGNKSYGITFQGLGGDEMSMDTEELASIVKGINEANADQNVKETKTEEKKTEEKKAEETKTEEKKASLISAAEAEALVEKTCGGTCTAIDLVTTKQYGECWYATAVDSQGTSYEYYVNNDDIYLISKRAAQKTEKKEEAAEASKQTNEAHYEGEPVTIYDSIYAEWHKSNDGEWYATFITYNNTQIFAQPAIAGGGWVFYALDQGKLVQVIYSDQESSVTNEYGPAGVSSHWQALNGDKWY